MGVSNRFDQDIKAGIKNIFRLWIGRDFKKLFQILKVYHNFRNAHRRRTALWKNEKLVVSPFIIFSATMKCNLTCRGCYSRHYPVDNELSLAEIDHSLTQAEQLGILFFVITGGEPLLRAGLLKVLLKHPEIIFLLFNNSSGITPRVAQQIGQGCNIIPLLSLEGDAVLTDERRGRGMYRQVIRSMHLLRRFRAFFGFSAMVTHKNHEYLGSDAFIDGMINRGCKMGLFSGYVPYDQNIDQDMVPSPPEQQWFHQQVKQFRRSKDIYLMHIPDDEYEDGGTCLAAGKGFVLINARGELEPCPFSHFACNSLRQKSLKAALKAPVFCYLRDYIKKLDPPQLGCVLYAHREILEEKFKRFGTWNTNNQPREHPIHQN